MSQHWCEHVILLSYGNAEDDLKSQISGLQLELTHANDLLSSMKEQGLHREALSLSAGAAEFSSLLKSGLTLTQIYSRFVQVSDELHREKEETTRLSNFLDQVMQELDEKTPALQKMMRDYEEGVCRSV